MTITCENCKWFGDAYTNEIDFEETAWAIQDGNWKAAEITVSYLCPECSHVFCVSRTVV